jgi:hypothetical protein
MKVLILTVIAFLGMAAAITAQSAETLTVKAGQQRSASKSKLKIKFVTVTADSRCPVGVACVWVGNATVKFEVISRRGRSMTIEANTTVGTKGDRFEGWAITLVSLTPVPRDDASVNPKDYVAKFTVTKI